MSVWYLHFVVTFWEWILKFCPISWPCSGRTMSTSSCLELQFLQPPSSWTSRIPTPCRSIKRWPRAIRVMEIFVADKASYLLWSDEIAQLRRPLIRLALKLSVYLSMMCPFPTENLLTSSPSSFFYIFYFITLRSIIFFHFYAILLFVLEQLALHLKDKQKVNKIKRTHVWMLKQLYCAFF